MKKITFFFIVIFPVLQVFSQTPQYTFTNGSGSNNIPLGGGAWADQRSQFLYLPGDFGPSVPSGMAISKIYFHSSSNYPLSIYTNFHVSIGQNNTTSFNGVWETGLTRVFTASTFSRGPGSLNDWVEIELDNPFPYDPSMPLIVETYQTATNPTGDLLLWSGGAPVDPQYVNSNTQNYASTSSTTPTSRDYSYHFGFDLISLLPNNTGAVSIDSPIVFCAGFQDIYATIANSGINQVNSVEVHWEVNGVSMPVIFYGQLLDTMNGNFPRTAQIHLGSVNLNAGANILKVWTANPNGTTDAEPSNDTIKVTLTTASPPTGVSFINTSMTSTDVSVIGGSGNYEFEYGPVGFTVGNGTFGTTNSSVFTISGLNPGTSYDVYLRTNCGSGDVSAWVGPFSFYTAAAIPFMQDFENFGTNLSGINDIEGWNNTASTAPEWETGMSTSSSGTGPEEDHTIGLGGTFAYLECSGGSLGDLDSLIGPPVFVPASTSSLTIEFWYHMHGPNMGKLMIYIDTNGVYTLIDSIVGEQHPNQMDPWLKYDTILNGLAGYSVRPIFVGIRGNGLQSDMAVDDIRIMETPSCLQPSDLTASNMTLNSADIGWTENNVATKWEIEYDTAGFTLGTGMRSVVTSNPANLSGLINGPDFEFYVRSICGRNDTSLWSGPFSFQTLTYSVTTIPPLTPNNGQSGVSFNVGANVDLKVVEIENVFNSGSIPYTIWYSTDSINGAPNISTTNNWIQHQSGTVAGNGTTPVGVQLVAPIEIPAGETYGFFIEAGTRYHTFSGPSVFTDGNLYINTGSNVGYGGAPPNPTFHIRQFVGTIVYELNIKSSNDAAIASVDSVLAVCAGSQNVYATVFNPGINQIDSVEVHWEINGVSQPMVHYKQLLDTANGLFSDSASILLGTANIIGGNNTIKVWTSMPNGVTDTVNTNDTLLINLFSPSSPSGVDFSNISTTTVDAIVMGVAGTINFEYGLSSFTLGNGTNGSSASSNFNISGLSPNTVYDVYVRNNCGANSSSWAGPFTFRTAIAVPYFQDFENFGSNNGINNIEGWNSTSTLIPQWQSGTNTSSIGTGPTEDHTIGAGGTFVFLECSGGSQGDFDSLISPQVYVDNSVTSLTLEFWYHMFGSNMGELEIYLDSNGVIIPIDTIVGQQQTAEMDPWLSHTTHLPGYGGSTVRVIFKGVRGNGLASDMSIDDVRLIESPSCLKPSGLSVVNLMATSVDLTWTENNIATEWEIQYDIDGFTFGTGNRDTITVNPYTVSGLSPNTTYEYYVRSICGRGDSSLWTGPFEFTTPCSPTTTLPYLQDFSTYVPVCWKEADDGNPASGPNSFGLSDWYTNDFLNDPANGQGVGINLYTIGRNDWIISEPFDLSSSVPQPYQLRMKVGLVQWASTTPGTLGSDDEIQLLISTDGGLSWNNLYTWNASNQPPGVGTNISVSLASYTGTNNLIAIWASEGLIDDPEDNEFYIDDFVIRQTPSCLEPTFLTASNISLTTADISWTENNSATQWEIEYGLFGFTKGSGTDSLVSTNPYTITGLTSSTTYEFYVRSVCGSGDTSAWVGPFEFMTSMGVPFIEDFETFPAGITANPWPNGWTTSTSTDPNWESEDATGLNENSVGTGPLYDHTLFGTPGGIYMYMETSTGVTGDTAELVSAPIYIDTSISSLTLDYWYFMYGANIDRMDVFIESNGVRALVVSYIGEQQTAQTDPWLNGNHILTGYAGQSVRIIFSGVNVACCTGDIAVDDVRLIETPSCIWPTNLDTANVTKSSAALSWTENNTATQWEIEYDTTGFMLGTGNRILANTNPYNISALLNGTDYDFYVRSICGAGDTSLWAGPFSFTTLFPAGKGGMIPIPAFSHTYSGTSRGFWFTAPTDFIITGLRVPTDIGLDDQNIHLVRFNAPPPAYAASTTAFTTLGYWNGVPGASIVATSIEIKQGDIIGVLGTRGTNSDNSYATPAGPFQSTILGQPVTLTRLLYQNDIHLNPATEFSEEVGGNIARVEIYYTPPTTGMNNAATVSVDSLKGFCAGLQDVYATIKNSGNNQIDSVEVYWELNGVLQPTVHYKQLLDTFSGTFPSEASILLGMANMVSGNNTVKVWTSMPNGVADTINSNDTIVGTLFSPSAPESAEFVNIQTTSVDVNVIGASGSIDYEFGLLGFTFGNGTTGSSANNPFNISGLIPDTEYDVYVRNNCGGNDTSSWVGSFSFRTAIAVPYVQDFESFGSNLSGINNIEGWNNTASTAPEWETGTNTSSTSTGPVADHTIGSGGTFVYLECSGGSQGDFDSLISPPIYFDTSYTDVVFEFWYHMYGSTMGDLEVYVDTNGVSNLITTISGQQQTSETDPWLQFTTHLTGYQGSSIRLIFKGIRGSNYYSDMSVDDISLTPLMPIDASLSYISAPGVQTCYTNSESVVVKMVNVGLDPMDFTVDSTLITVNMSGANTQTISFMVNNNSINNGSPLGQLDTLSIPVGTVDMTNPGTYYFDATLSSTNDGLADNNNFKDTLEGSRNGKLVGAATLCTGDSATLYITGHRGSVQWQMNSASGFVDIVGATSNSVKVGPTLSTDYRAVVCGNLLSDTATLNPVTPTMPLATDSMLTVFCGNNGVVGLSASTTSSNSKFEWYSSPLGGDPLRVGGSIYDITLYGDTLFYQASPSQLIPAIDTFYVQEVVLSGSGICASARDTAIATIDCIVGIDEDMEIAASNISIYPNPSDGVFKVVGTNVEGDVQISIYNTNGKKVYQSENKFSNDFDARIDISGFAKGLYFVKLQSETNTEIKKIVVQ